MTLAELVRSRRDVLGYTLDDVVARTDLSRSAISSIELGHTKMPREAKDRRALARALGVRHIDLLIAAGVIDADEVPIGAAPAPPSEADTLLTQVPLEVREIVMASLRLAARHAEQMRGLRAALRDRDATAKPL